VKGWVAFSRDTTEEFVKFVEANDIKPVIAKTFEFGEAVEALETLQSQSLAGKIVIRIGEN